MRCLKIKQRLVILLSNTRLTGTTTTNDNANLPIKILNRQRTHKPLLQLNIVKRVTTDDTLCPKTICLFPTLYNVKIRSLYPSDFNFSKTSF
ncbi:hypothetical protein IMZ68_05880 [Candidatus Bathyarchaeota archaeon]|nr:hypothetical protein [Candidatus Bathyarchaeota archaeon]